MAEEREIREGIQPQGEGEEIAYKLNTSNLSYDPSSPSTPTAATAKIYSIAYTLGVPAYTDTTTTNMSGAASISTYWITLPVIKSLVAKTEYKVVVEVTLEGNKFKPYAYIQGER